MIRSLRVRLMLAAAVLALLFMLALLPALQKAFSLALQESIEQRLASDVTTLISAARIEHGQLQMPALLPDERFNLPYTGLLGYIFDRNGQMVWRSRATADQNINYQPRYDGRGNEFARIHQNDGEEFFVYDVEIKLLGGQSAAYSIVALQPVSEYKQTLAGLREKLYLGFGAALLALLALLWAGLTWGLRSLRRLSRELDEVESGARDGLSAEHPRELLRLTGSLNRLLRSEREQRQRAWYATACNCNRCWKACAVRWPRSTATSGSRRCSTCRSRRRYRWGRAPCWSCSATCWRTPIG